MGLTPLGATSGAQLGDPRKAMWKWEGSSAPPPSKYKTSTEWSQIMGSVPSKHPSRLRSLSLGEQCGDPHLGRDYLENILASVEGASVPQRWGSRGQPCSCYPQITTPPVSDT